MPVVAVGRPLREKLGDDGVDSLVQLINQSQGEHKNDILKMVEEKFERRLSEEIGRVEKNLLVKIAETKTELMTIILELKAEQAKSKAELIKWMFIFWVGQLGMMLGILFAFFK